MFWPRRSLAADRTEGDVLAASMLMTGRTEAMFREGDGSRLTRLNQRLLSPSHHGDLLSRNVHVENGSITGVFDWGCQRWGDHLFDLAGFDFWSAWCPNLDIAALRAALQDRWATAGYQPPREADRTTAGLVYIVLEHLVYNAVVGRWSDLDEVVDRMKRST